MAEYGLGNFIYELEVKDGNANFKFRDPQDANNTAEVSVAQADFPDGAAADSRQVADLAFAQCSKVLNDKRDARTEKTAADDLANKIDEDQRAREAAEDFQNNAQDVTVAPAGEEKDKDGNVTSVVYNTAEPTDNAPKSDKKK